MPTKLPIEIVKLSDEPQADGHPFEATILSGEPIGGVSYPDGIQRGPFVVDYDTLICNPRVSVNYNHNDEIILGYGENIHATPEGLKSTGKFVAGDEFCDKIIRLSKSGVPFEASVEIDLDGLGVIETQVGTNETAVVNGRTYHGPLFVYRNVPLKAYAICPHGADKFTTFTLLKEEKNYVMKKKLTPPTTNLSDDKPSGESPESKVKDPALAEFCEVYGLEKGCELYQSGADIEDIRTLKELIEKYGVPEPPGTEEPTTELNEEDPLTKPAEDKENTELTKLNAEITALRAEVTKLHAALPRGEEAPVKHNFQQETPPKELSNREQYLETVKKRIQK